MTDVYPQNLWEKSLKTVFERIGALSFISDEELHIYPEMEFPIPGLNPDIEFEGQRAPTGEEQKIGDNKGALWNRERMGCAMIEFTLNQPGFSKIDEFNIENSVISPNFRVNVWFARDYPSQGVGHGFLFVDSDGFELPHYPNIMRRSEHTPYWSNISSVSKRPYSQPWPEGCMCLHALNNKTPLDDVIGRIKQYLSVPSEQFGGSINNDQGFDQELFKIYKDNKENLAKMIRDYNPSEPIKPRTNPVPPPPPPPARRKKANSPPPPPPPARRRR